MSVGSSDLVVVLWSVGGFLLVVGAVAGIVAWIARRRGSSAVVVKAALLLSSGWLALGLVSLPFSLAQTLSDSSVWIPGLPVDASWPEPLPCGRESGADAPYIECATLSSANAWIVGLPLAARAVLALGQGSAVIVSMLPAALIAVICILMLRGRPFAAVASRTLVIGAVVVLVAGLTADIASAIGRGLAAQAVLPASGTGDLTAGAAFSVSVELWPIGAALALGALAAVFRYGQGLQRDTQGLV